MTSISLGALLNTLRTPTKCPDCWQPSRMAVHEYATRWGCGHTRPLPPLRKSGPGNNNRRERTQ